MLGHLQVSGKNALEHMENILLTMIKIPQYIQLGNFQF